MSFAFFPLGYICSHCLHKKCLLADLPFYFRTKIMFQFKLSHPCPKCCIMAQSAISCLLWPTTMTGQNRLRLLNLFAPSAILCGGQMNLLYCEELSY